MKDSEKLRAIMNGAMLNVTEFAEKIGLDGPQILYNILGDKHRISKKVARMIVSTFPDLVSFDEIVDESKQVQIGNKGTNIQSKDSNVNISDNDNLKLKYQFLQEKIAMYEQELKDCKEREKMYLNIIKQLDQK